MQKKSIPSGLTYGIQSCCESAKMRTKMIMMKWQWELHVKNMNQAKWEEEQALEEARKKDLICLDDTSDEESVKEKPKAVICLLDDSYDEKDKENVCSRKHFKKE
jgi:hypothetical protein